MSQKLNEESILSILRGLTHPEKKQDIVTLGLISDVLIDGTGIHFTVRPLSPNDPFGTTLMRQARRLVSEAYPEVGVEATLQIPERREEVAKDLPPRIGGIKGIKHVLAVASGKGGVGKSTVTVNLAVALARKGLKVGILDADVFGPSVPLMLGVEDDRPAVDNRDGEDIIIPVEAYGVKMLSMAFFVASTDALVWRGPMASNALKQIIHMGLWEELDYLLIDMPPGTSDIHLTITQEFTLSGAIIVSTPQRVALADAQKALSLFSNPEISVPIVGLVENMSWLEMEDGTRQYIFGKGGAKALAEELGIPLLGEIPITQALREGGDTGCPLAAGNGVVSAIFDSIASTVLHEVEDS
ncbi:MAG: P-loop NTPase [Bacteroides sp.]